MTNAHTIATADLESVGIDSAELRWLATRDYLDDLAEEVSHEINALALVAEFCDLAEQNAIRRLGKDALCILLDDYDSPYGPWGPKLIANDYLTARSAVLVCYQGKARLRALEILNDYVPPELRVPKVNVGSTR